MNTAAKIFSLLSVLLMAAPSAQATLHRTHVVDYGDGISMKQNTDNADFVMTIKGGPTFKFDSGTQTVLMTRPNGSTKLVKFTK